MFRTISRESYVFVRRFTDARHSSVREVRAFCLRRNKLRKSLIKSRAIEPKKARGTRIDTRVSINGRRRDRRRHVNSLAIDRTEEPREKCRTLLPPTTLHRPSPTEREREQDARRNSQSIAGSFRGGRSRPSVVSLAKSNRASATL